jgi:hypothetical protein
VIEGARDEWMRKGGRPWQEVEAGMEEAVSRREPGAGR